IQPMRLWLCLENKTYDLALVAQQSEYKWRVYTLPTANLCFWDLGWEGERRYIPKIYDFINQVHISFRLLVHGRIFKASQLHSLVSGETYPGQVMTAKPYIGHEWADDIRDIRHKYSISTAYEQTYGEWFIKVQEWFRKYARPDQGE